MWACSPAVVGFGRWWYRDTDSVLQDPAERDTTCTGGRRGCLELKSLLLLLLHP